MRRRRSCRAWWKPQQPVKKSLSPNRANRWSPGPLAGLRQKRGLGILAEKLRVPEDFGDPLPDEVIEAFEGR
jgi:hypothetical protein